MAGPMRGPGHGGPGRGHNFKEKEKPKDLKATIKKLGRYIGYSKKLFISSIVVILLLISVISLLTSPNRSLTLVALATSSITTLLPDALTTGEK